MTDPSGWKLFADGAVLPAEEIRGYLQQGVMVFDNAAARDSTLVGALREGMIAYVKDTDVVSYYDGSAWNVITGQIAFTSEAARDAAIPNPVDGRYAYITDTVSLFVWSSGSWVKVGPDVETDKNLRSFTASTTTAIPVWATKIYYCVVGGGANGLAGDANNARAGGAGGQVTQGSTTTFTSGGTITITVGGAGANSSIAIPGGSTFTGTGGGGAAGGAGQNSASGLAGNGSAGTIPNAPLDVAYFGGGGGGAIQNGSPMFASVGGAGGGGAGAGGRNATAGEPGTGGGGGGGGFFGSSAAGGSGRVLLYFS